jgi:hypothetical protein
MGAPEEPIAKGFDDTRHGVGHDEELVFAIDIVRHGEDDGRDEHQQLDAKGSKMAEVFVTGSQGGDDHAGAQPQAGDENYQHREEESEQIGSDSRRSYEEVNVNKYEYQQLYGELHQVRQDKREGDDKPGEVYFAEYGVVVFKERGSTEDAFRKIRPKDQTAEIEQEGRQIGVVHLPYAGKNDDKGDGSKEGLEEEPDGAQDRLFINREDVSANQDKKKVSVMPDLFQVQRENIVLWCDDLFPGPF